MGLKSFWQYKTCLKYSLVHLQVMTIRHLFVREYECFVLRLCIFYRFFYRDVGNGWGTGVARPPTPDFSRSVNPISTRGANYTHQITTRPSPQIFRTSDIPDSIRDDDAQYLPFTETYGQFLTYTIQKIIDPPYPQEAFCKTKLSVIQNDILTID